MTINIIPAPADFKDQIKAICAQTFADHQSAQPFAFPANLYETQVSHTIDNAFLDETGTALDASPVLMLAMRDGEMAGYIHLSWWAHPDRTQMPYVNIDDIHVVQAHRGTGVGEALLDHVKSRADEHDWNDLTATIWAPNAASKALFERCGFTKRSTQMRYGPNKQARDYPVIKPKTPSKTRRLPEAACWLILGMFIYAIIVEILY